MFERKMYLDNCECVCVDLAVQKHSIQLVSTGIVYQKKILDLRYIDNDIVIYPWISSFNHVNYLSFFYASYYVFDQ